MMYQKAFKSLLLLSIVVLAHLAAFAQNQGYPINPNPGKCYEKCLVQTSATDSFPVYTGSYPTEVALDTLTFPSEDMTTWVQIPPPTMNCLNCSLWHLVTITAGQDTLVVVSDPEETDAFSWKKYPPIQDYAVYREVLCNHKVNERFIRLLVLALNREGYNVPPGTKARTKELTRALVKYQTDNNLPRGRLDIETLERLGVNY